MSMISKIAFLSILSCIAILPSAYSDQIDQSNSNKVPNNNDMNNSYKNGRSEDPDLVAARGGGGGGHGNFGGGRGDFGGRGNWDGGRGGNWDHGNWNHGNWNGNYWGGGYYGGAVVVPGYGYYDSYSAPYDPYYYYNNNGYYYTPQ